VEIGKKTCYNAIKNYVNHFVMGRRNAGMEYIEKRLDGEEKYKGV